MQQSNPCRILQAVREPLENGLLSFNRLTEMILSMDADLITPGCQTFNDFRQEIQKIENYLNESEQMANKELEQLDKKTETLTEDKYNLEKKRKEQDAELADLKIHLELFEFILMRCMEARDAAQRNLESAKETLKEMEQKIDYAETVRDVGIGLLVIPVLGWIAGGIMIGVGQADLDSALDRMNKASQEALKYFFQTKVYSLKVFVYKELISEALRETTKVNSRISELDAELEVLSVKRKTVANLQSQTREVVHHLGLLSGVGSAAELQTRKQILVQTIMRVIKEVTPVLTQIIEDGLLPTQGLKRIMEEMETNQRKLKVAIP